MRARTLIVAVLTVAALALVTGCGGDEEQGASQASQETVEQETASGERAADEAAGDGASEGGGDATGGGGKGSFVAEANAICEKRAAQVQKKGQRVFDEVFSEPRQVAAKAMADRVVIPIFEGEVRELRALDQPPGDNPQLQAVYDEIDEMLAELKRDPVGSQPYPYTEAEDAAKRYGISACGHP